MANNTTASNKLNLISNGITALQNFKVALDALLRITQQAKDLKLDASVANVQAGTALVDADFAGTTASYMTASQFNQGIITIPAALDTALSANSRQNYIAIAACLPNPQ